MPRIGWIITGSRVARSQKSTKVVFMANVTGTLVVTYHDPDAIIDNPLPEGGDDTVYYSNSNILPQKDTPVKVIFSAKPLSERKPFLLIVNYRPIQISLIVVCRSRSR